MIREFAVPALGDSVAEVEIAAWLVEVGQPVAVDEEVVEVQTDKSTMCVPSPWRGVLHARHAVPGDVLPVGAPLFSIDTGQGAP